MTKEQQQDYTNRIKQRYNDEANAEITKRDRTNLHRIQGAQKLCTTVNEIRVNGRTPVVLSIFENNLPWQVLHE
jgi:hypothetical protein